jgi:hypothetical protein
LTEYPPPTADETDAAQGLIDRERADLRAGFTVITIFFLIVGITVGLLGFFVVRRFIPAALPVGAVIALLMFAFGRRMRRFVIAARQARRNWQEGKLSNGEDAVAAARRFLADHPAHE